MSEGIARRFELNRHDFALNALAAVNRTAVSVGKRGQRDGVFLSVQIPPLDFTSRFLRRVADHALIAGHRFIIIRNQQVVIDIHHLRRAVIVDLRDQIGDSLRHASSDKDFAGTDFLAPDNGVFSDGCELSAVVV